MRRRLAPRVQYSYKEFSIAVDALSLICLGKLVAAGTKWSEPDKNLYRMMCADLCVLLRELCDGACAGAWRRA